MLGPKKSTGTGGAGGSTTTRLTIGSGGGCSSSLKKPTASRASFGSSSPRTGAVTGSGAARQQQASQSSLLAAGKSTSRSSILSDTTASVSSSLIQQQQQQQQQLPGIGSSRSRLAGGINSTSQNITNRNSSSSSLISRASSSLANGNGTSAGSKQQPAKAKTTTTTRIGTSFSSASSSAASSTISATGSGGSNGRTSGSTRASYSKVALTGTTQSALSSATRRVPTLAMSARDKDQQIKLLIKERDEQKFQAELMARKAEEWEEKFNQSELEKSHVTSEADDEVIELRRLSQELEDENKRLVARLSEREQEVSDTQFKFWELEISSSALKQELQDKEEQLKAMEEEQKEILSNGKPVAQVNTERAVSKAKYEREIEELKEKILSREEQMMQLRSSLEMRKNEVTNLQSHAGDLERRLKIESERSERHLKRIDEINLELKASEAKLATKSEENEMYERQVRQLRQELRAAEEKLEQISLARKKDVDILHNKLSAARRGSTTPTSPQPYKTPTPQDEIVRLQMEIRDLKDQLIDREAELDCNRRDMDVMKRKMETRTLEVDCNNQELARRCQDLLEQNRQSEDTVKQLLKSSTEHSAQLLRATDDLKEANGKCVKLRDEINELETKLDEQLKRANQLNRDNAQLKDENDEYKEQVEMLRQQVDSLNEQLGQLCEQLDVQTNNLHRDREALANQLSQNEIDSAQLRHDLATAKQDLRTSKLQTQEVASERDRLKSEMEIKEKYIASRNDIIETLRHELEDCKRSLEEYKQKIEHLKESNTLEAERSGKEMRAQLDSLKRDYQLRSDEAATLRAQCEQLEKKLQEIKTINEEEELKKFDEMRQKHSAELDSLKLKLKDLEEQLDEAKSATLKRDQSGDLNKNKSKSGSQVTVLEGCESGANSVNNDNNVTKQQSCKSPTGDSGKQRNLTHDQDYETQIEFLNSVVVDMQRKCDDYKNRLAQIETVNIMNEFDNLIISNQTAYDTTSRASTIQRASKNINNNKNENHSNSNYTPSATATNTLTHSTKADNNNHFTASSLDGPIRQVRPISGRPFCDICNVYDLHHTVYCPKVSEKLAARNQMAGLECGGNDNNNYIAGNNINSGSEVDELFREYEQSIQSASMQQFTSLRRPKTLDRPPRPYCDHCDLFGHTIKSCNSLKV